MTDDDAVRTAAVALLATGARVVVAAPAAADAALPALTTLGVAPRAIVLDLVPPSAGAWGVLAACNDVSVLAAVPLVVLLATPAPRPAGAAAALTKPVSGAALQAVVARVCAAPRVLLVEDDVDFAACVALVLERAGYRVALARSVAEAHGSLALEAPALILVDHHLPDGDSRAVLAVRGLTPAVVLSGAARTTAVAYDNDVVFMAKPVDFDDLLAVVARHAGAPPAV